MYLYTEFKVQNISKMNTITIVGTKKARGIDMSSGDILLF